MDGFEWDPEKERRNRRKHGISFAEAAMIFDGPVLSRPDEGDHGEDREQSFGLLGGVVVVCVVHTERDGITRIVSARKATPHERKLFHARLRQAAR